jgi:hypothetical protein
MLDASYFIPVDLTAKTKEMGIYDDFEEQPCDVGMLWNALHYLSELPSRAGRIEPRDPATTLESYQKANEDQNNDLLKESVDNGRTESDVPPTGHLEPEVKEALSAGREISLVCLKCSSL